jgi:hypothetical protein
MKLLARVLVCHPCPLERREVAVWRSENYLPVELFKTLANIDTIVTDTGYYYRKPHYCESLLCHSVWSTEKMIHVYTVPTFTVIIGTFNVGIYI